MNILDKVMGKQEDKTVNQVRVVMELAKKTSNGLDVKTFATYITPSTLTPEIVSLVFKINTGEYTEQEMNEFYSKYRTWDVTFKNVAEYQDVSAITINLRYCPKEDEVLAINNTQDYNLFTSRLAIDNIKTMEFPVSYTMNEEKMNMDDVKVENTSNDMDMEEKEPMDFINVSNLMNISDQERMFQVKSHAYEAASSGKYFINEVLSTSLVNKLMDMGLSVTQETLNVYKISWLK